jgi:hypothetical protein
MPLGGYCTVCQRWVWLTPYGECQNGHPALAVKDVQQLKPQAESDVLVGEVLEEGKPRARFRWWWRHSAWILWTFTLGFMNWLGFVYVGVRDEVVGLCSTADQIIAELASQPRKLDAARGFLTYYLDAAQRIVEGYVNLARRGGSAPEINQTLARAEASLKVVQEAFDRQLANVLEDRAMDLDSEIELLERTVRSDTMYTQTGELS